MSDDIVYRLRHVAWLAEEGSEVTDLAAAAADEIVRLRERVTELEAENAEFRDQFATADEVAALLEANGGNLDDVEGWVKVNFPDWRALADQLAEAIRGPANRHIIPNDDEWNAWQAMRQDALAAYDRARKENR